MGEEHLHYQRNHGEISPVKLHRGGTYNPIIVDISTKRHNKYRRCVFRSGEDDSGILLASSFLHKKIPLKHRRSYKYDAGQIILIGTPLSSDVCEREIPKFAMVKRRANSIRNVSGEILQLK